MSRCRCDDYRYDRDRLEYDAEKQLPEILRFINESEILLSAWEVTISRRPSFKIVVKKEESFKMSPEKKVRKILELVDFLRSKRLNVQVEFSSKVWGYKFFPVIWVHLTESMTAFQYPDQPEPDVFFDED